MVYTGTTQGTKCRIVWLCSSGLSILGNTRSLWVRIGLFTLLVWVMFPEVMNWFLKNQNRSTAYTLFQNLGITCQHFKIQRFHIKMCYSSLLEKLRSLWDPIPVQQLSVGIEYQLSSLRRGLCCLHYPILLYSSDAHWAIQAFESVKPALHWPVHWSVQTGVGEGSRGGLFTRITHSASLILQEETLWPMNDWRMWYWGLPPSFGASLTSVGLAEWMPHRVSYSLPLNSVFLTSSVNFLHANITSRVCFQGSHCKIPIFLAALCWDLASFQHQEKSS